MITAITSYANGVKFTVDIQGRLVVWTKENVIVSESHVPGSVAGGGRDAARVECGVIFEVWDTAQTQPASGPRWVFAFAQDADLYAWNITKGTECVCVCVCVCYAWRMELCSVDSKWRGSCCS